MSADSTAVLPISRSATGDALSPHAEDAGRLSSPVSQTLVHDSAGTSSAPVSPNSLESRASEIEPAAQPPDARSPPRNTKLQALSERVALLEKELIDSEQTHRLR